MPRSLPMNLSFQKTKFPIDSQSASQTLVLGVLRQGDKAAFAKTLKSNKDLSAVFAKLEAQAQISGKADTTHSFLANTGLVPGFENLILLGVGTPKDLTPQKVLHWGG